MAFQQGLSGLNATSKSLEVIGNNIANAGTYGFKASRAEFSDVYAASLNGAGTNPIGIGTNLTAVAQQFTQGNITATDNNLDLAINGTGFFQLQDKFGNPPVYSRNGQLKVDEEGFVVNSQGLRLLGTGLKPLQVSGGEMMKPERTTKVEIEFNLKASDKPTDYDGAFNASRPKTYSDATSITVYDDVGERHTLTLYFRKTGTSTWDVYGFLNGSQIGTTRIAELTFDTTGKKTAPTGLTSIGPLPGIGGTMGIGFDATHYAAPFGVTDTVLDGRAAGTPTSLVVGSDGSVMVRYSNGQSSKLGDIELVSFRNPQGLQPLGNNVWASTYASGEVSSRGTPGSGNLGVLQSGALEESNVDLTAELVSMITAQRLYQANAQTIKTTDQAMQTLVNLR